MSSPVKTTFALQPLMSHIASFLDGVDRDSMAQTCHRANALLDTKDKLGDVASTETFSQAALSHEFSRCLYHQRQLFASLADKSMLIVDHGELKAVDRTAFLNKGSKKLKYKMGFYHLQAAKYIHQLVVHQMKIVHRLYVKPPKSLQQMRDRFVRIRHIAAEIQGLQYALERDRSLLTAAGGAMFDKLKDACKKTDALLKNSMSLLIGEEAGKKEDRSIGLLHGAAMGKSYTAHSPVEGIYVGRTYINEPDVKEAEEMHVYATLPIKEDEGSFPTLEGHARFSIINKENEEVGFIVIARCWSRSHDKNGRTYVKEHFQRTELQEIWGKELAVEHPPADCFWNRRLIVDNLYADDSAFIDNDQPIVRKLMQIAVEILLREQETKLEADVDLDHPYVFAAGGFDCKPADKQKMLQKIEAARKKGTRYPYKQADLYGWNVRMNILRDQVLATEVNFGDKADKGDKGDKGDKADKGVKVQTWADILTAGRILDGSGPILPRYCQVNLFKLDVQKRS